MMADDEVLSKTGVELFRELLRVYPVGELDDYYKGGVWRDDMMKTDLILVEAHRREAGAPDPLPLEEIVVPDIPKPLGGVFLPGVGAAGLVRPLGVTPPALTVTPNPAAVTPPAGGAVAELRLIALFVAKWKLDPAKTKMMLAKIAAPRRRYVIQNFKLDEGAEVMPALEAYMAECESTGAWGEATAPTPAGLVIPPGVGGARPVTPRPLLASSVTPAMLGVKRPLTPMGGAAVIAPAKRPCLTVPPSTGNSAWGGAAWGGAGGNAWGQQPVAPRAVAPRPVAATIRPQGAAPAGALIKNLLQRF